MRLMVSAILLAMIFSAAPADAMSCHCFPARTFDPAQPAATAPYLLATAQNSFFAVIFGIDKKEVVFAKQKPATTAENMWVAYWVAQRSGAAAKELLTARNDRGAWKEVLPAESGLPGKLPRQFAALMQSGADDAQLSRTVVNLLLEEKGLILHKELEMLRREGATDPETILTALLARKTGISALKLFRDAKKGRATWGEMLEKAGIDGRQMVSEIQRLLGKGIKSSSIYPILEMA